MKTEPDPHWEAFAVREPFFAVLTASRYLRANLTAERLREFFESGEELVDSIMRIIEMRLVPQFAPASILEYGCGVGRLAIPFARRVGAVVAVDRSPAMLDVARREAQRQGAAHIEFCTPTELAAKQRKFDLVNCYLLLQRMPQAEGLVLVRELLGYITAGGIGVFHVPLRTTTTAVVAASRWLRERLPPINGVANLMRGRPFAEPFLGSHVYDLDEVVHALEAASIEAIHLVFEPHQGLAGARIFVEAPLSFTPVLDERDGSAPSAEDREAARSIPVTVGTGGDSRSIDVGRMIAGASIDSLNRTAEEYFASLTNWDHHLAKPFSNVNETPALLTNVATLLQGLQLTPGTTVLDFGGGTGWLSRCLTQLGCRVVILDVSPTALRIARELYRRLPIIGDRPAPVFLQFDGQHISLPDSSVERILSFHAFHHAPNPEATLREFGRVLKPGGIAGFAEPGPRHSRTPMSQFEMRTYGVVENDIDVHAIWRTARTCGFRDLKLVLFHTPPYHVSLQEYEDFLAGGATCARWVGSTRGFLRHVRSFFLFKEGSERPDSRAPRGLACEIHATLATRPAIEGQPVLIEASVTNSGTAVWLPSDAPFGGVALGAHMYDESGRLLTFDVNRGSLTSPPREIAPGETVVSRVSVLPQTAGRYLAELDCVASEVTWFAQVGSRAARVAIQVVAGRPKP
jgi:ubiquinone/menaquinone biosynthesis C-methylase UbiE